MASRGFYDPAGRRYGVPTWPWGMAPAGLATRTQLRSRGLRPGGQEIAAQVRWRTRSGRVRTAHLYRAELALPVRPMTPARERALARAMLARHTCRSCGELHDYCLPTSLGGTCPPGTGCAADTGAPVLQALAA